MDTEKVTNKYGSYTDYDCYNVFNDDVVNGIISNNNGYTYYSSAYYAGDKISLSKEAAEKLISARRRISVTAFDKASKISGMTVEFDGYFLNNEAVSVDIPKITLSKDASTLSTTFAGGTPEYVYKVGTIPSIKGVSFRSTFYNSGDGRFNVYAVDDGSCIPVVQRTYGYTKSFTESDSNSEYFTISLDNDNFIKTATVSGGDYDGTEYSYIANPDVQTIKNIVKYNAKKNISSSINVCTDKVTFDAETINMIKNAEDAGITVNFYDSNIGRSAGSATTSTYKLENVEAKDVTIERPAVEITSNNADFEKVMDPTLAVRYVSASSALADGFTYRFTDPTVLNAKFDNEQTYVKLSLVDGKLVRSGSLVPSRTIVVEKNTYALVRSADYSTPGDTPSTPSDTPSKPEQPSEPEQPSKPEQPSEPEQPSDNGDTTGKNVEAEVISVDKLTNVENVNNELTERLTNSSLSEVSIVSAKAAPTLSSNVFSKMKENQKDITVGVTDENNRLQYQWKFNSDTITQPDMDIDLTISFDTDRENEVKEITGRDDLMYLSFSHHGALPGPATIKTYVGNKYKDGDIVYLYYFNEEQNRVESVGGVNKGLVVKDGYVEYTITHCSLYFLSQDTAEVIKAVDPDTADNNGQVADVADTAKDSAATGDTTRVFLYVLETLMAAVLVAGLVVADVKKNRINR